MPRRVILPPRFDRPLSVQTALALGIGEGRLRGHDLHAPFHGVRAPARGAASLLERCLEYAPLLTQGQRFSHATAAALWGCPIDNRAIAGAIHVSSPGRAPRSVGIAGHHTSLGTTVWRHGLPVSDPVSTWLELASMLPVDELVVAADHLVLDPRELDPRDIRPHATLDELRRALDTFHGRGAAAADLAHGHARSGAESRPETHLRLLVSRSGFPEPEVNPQIIVGGRSLGYGDLYFREWHTLCEYDGDHHRTNRKQYDTDMLRIERLERWGEQVVRVRDAGLYRSPAASMARLAHALRLKGWPG